MKKEESMMSKCSETLVAIVMKEKSPEQCAKKLLMLMLSESQGYEKEDLLDFLNTAMSMFEVLQGRDFKEQTHAEFENIVRKVGRFSGV